MADITKDGIVFQSEQSKWASQAAFLAAAYADTGLNSTNSYVESTISVKGTYLWNLRASIDLPYRAPYIQRNGTAPTGAILDPVSGGLLALANSSQVAQSAQISQTTGLPIVLGRSTTPDQIAGLTCWFDASQPMYTTGYAAQVANLGDQIGIWPDRSGNAVTCTPSATKPTFNPTGLNGKPTINFNGNSTFTTGTVLSSANNTGLTIFVVSQALASAANKVILGLAGSTSFLQCADSTKTRGFNMSGLTPNLGSAIAPYVNTSGIDAYVYNGTSQYEEYDRTIYVNNGVFGNASASSGASSGGTSPVATTGTLGLAGAITIGDLAAGGFTWPGQISELIVYAAALTAEQTREIYDYLSVKWGFSVKKALVCCGNSRTSGTGSTGGATQVTSPSGTSYPSQLWAALGSSAWDIRTDAYPGRQLNQMLSETPTFGDLYWLPQASSKNIAICWECINTLNNVTISGAGAYQKYVQYCKARRAQGFKVIACTEINNTPTGYFAGYFNELAYFNSLVRANYSQFADAICDLAADARLSNYTNLTYFFTDGVHLNGAGYAVVASLLTPVVLSL